MALWEPGAPYRNRCFPFPCKYRMLEKVPASAQVRKETRTNSIHRAYPPPSAPPHRHH